MDNALSLLAEIGQITLEPLWLPVVIWTLLTVIVLTGLYYWSHAHPLVQYRARQALLAALPLGFLAGWAISLWPEAAVQPATLAVSPELTGAYVSATPTDGAGSSTLSFTIVHAAGALTIGAVLASFLAFAQLTRSMLKVEQFSNAGSSDVAPKNNFPVPGLNLDGIEIKWSDTQPLPMTWGLRRPTILLPRSLQNQPARARLTLLHELIHVRRRDYLSSLSESAVSALFAFHPLVWLLKATINRYREQACDAEVLRQPGISAREYASLLLDFTERPSASPLPLAMAHRSTKTRIEAMKNYIADNRHLRNPWISSLLVAGIILAIVGGIAACSELSPVDEGMEPDENVEMQSALSDEEVYEVVEDDPQLIGGLKGLHNEISYPQSALDEGVEGRVFVRFVVTPEGDVRDAEVTRSPDERLSEEALRVVREAKFEPARQSGEPVHIRMAIPISFNANASSRDTDATSSSQDPQQEAYDEVDEAPQLIGGLQGLHEQVTYPDFAREAEIEGRVFTEFIVDEQGNVVDTDVRNTPHDVLANEARRVIENAQFEPGRINGEPVRVRMTLPITFSLSDASQSIDSEGRFPPQEIANAEVSGRSMLNFYITGNGQIQLEGSVVLLEDLAEMLRDDSRRHAVRIVASPAATLGVLHDLQHQLRQAGITQISIADRA